jgi:hypothetical protein
VIDEVARRIGESDERITCDGVMKHAILSARDAVSADAQRRLELIVGKYLRS